MKKIIKLLPWIAFFFLLCIEFGYQQWQIGILKKKNEDQEVMINAHDKQIFIQSEFLLLLGEIRTASEKVEKGRKMTGYEAVEVAKEIVIQCQLNDDIGLTPAIVLALIERESGFQVDAISKMKAYGLTQCIYTTFEYHLPTLGYGLPTRELMFDPIVNVQVGMAELIRLKRLWLAEGVESRDDWKITFYSYYAGERWTRLLLTTLKKSKFPGLEYGVGTTKLVQQWRERGVM